MPTTTTNYGFTKPNVNDPTDQDLWGGYLNDNFDDADSLLKTATDFVVRAVSSADTAVTSDRNKTIVCDATSAPFTFTLLAAATAGDGFTIVITKEDASGNSVTIDGNSSETIGGNSSYDLTGEGDSVILICDGSNWHIAGTKTTPSAVPSASTTTEGVVELITASELQAGTDSTRAVTASALKTSMGYTKYAESSQLSLGSAWRTFTHGLGETPKKIEVEMVCVVNDAGYIAGSDVITIYTHYSGSGRGLFVYKNATTIGVYCAFIYYVNTAGTLVTLTPSSWRMVVRAWA